MREVKRRRGRSSRADVTRPHTAANRRAHPVKGYPYAFHIALDGNGINGLEGMAGVCLFLYDPDGDAYAYKVTYFEGAAAGHAVSVNPSGTVGFLGNAGQQLLFYDATTLEEVSRISTLQFEPVETSLQGSTHLVWLDERTFISAVGAYFYRFDLDRLDRPERLVAHNVRLPHGMKLTRSGRYLCYGSMDNPHYGRDGEAKHVGILDLRSGEVTVIPLPATCWHVAVHPEEERFYCLSFRVLPQDYVDYHEWAMAFLKEYAFEIDAKNRRVLRHWVTGRETPAHINSDVVVSNRELIFCNGGSQSIVCIDLETFAKFRIIDERPNFGTMLEHPREMATQIYDSFARGNFFTNSRHFFGALRISRFSLLDSIYACQLSRNQRYLFTANRGLNHVTIYDYPSAKIRLRVQMPSLHHYAPHLASIADPRLGFHHAILLG